MKTKAEENGAVGGKCGCPGTFSGLPGTFSGLPGTFSGLSDTQESGIKRGINPN